MGGPERLEQALALLARRGSYEVLSALDARGGTATFAQIAAEASSPTAILRAMAAYGFVVSVCGGSLDGDPLADTHFSLTAKGQAIFGHLLRLHRWVASRTSSAGGVGTSINSAQTEEP
ncbi:hypothetical protein [Micromonospora sp. CNB394]|uniref:hypothetical protein n=1 Tax=Micromonospora sp. CNB394 TaxID=1169151 RepID=UPI00055EF4A4|nr:hypothetical protein [Micromonospora sp. CNB394]